MKVDLLICPSTGPISSRLSTYSRSSGRTVSWVPSVHGEPIPVRGEPVEPPAGVEPSSRRNSLLLVGLLALCALLLAACSGDPTPPRDLLLSADDFPFQGVTETNRQEGESNLEEPAVQVELTSPGFTVLESLVLFESDELALNILSEIKQDQIARGVTSQPVEGFDDNSGVLEEKLHGEDASTVFFVEGQALVRITLSGEARAEFIWEIAHLAREKSRS